MMGRPSKDSLARIEREVVSCTLCPRLVEWREKAARKPPRRFAGESYWARPLPAFGDSRARVLFVGLAPAAHGGNRTGRVFTGDESGNFLFSALYQTGLANRPASVRANDGLRLSGALVTAACRCAPPDNRPTPEEFSACRPFLVRELRLLRPGSAIVALGSLAFSSVLAALAEAGAAIPKPKPRFAHGARFSIGGFALFGSYHPSQQNTFTGKLTQGMLRAVLRRAVRATS
ncbi:MAG TPA: uracil-DNA glycosylase [Thermoanaerobaculia bacterium]|nr:uracil-DNA glycosylase [Thermoanaerobaculia bacterium]